MRQVCPLTRQSRTRGTARARTSAVGTILGEVVHVRRYRPRHVFAAADGTALIATSSGRATWHRLTAGAFSTAPPSVGSVAADVWAVRVDDG